jgi:hypothetical protein
MQKNPKWIINGHPPTIHHPQKEKKRRKKNQNHSEVETGDFVRKKNMERFLENGGNWK